MDYVPYMEKIFGPPTRLEMERLLDLAGEAGLPDDYMEFLVQTGGGLPVLDWMVFQTSWGVEGAVLSLLLSPTSERGSYQGVLGATLASLEQNLVPPMSLVIAADTADNSLLMSLEPENFGAVYFWNQERTYPNQVHIDCIADYANTMTRVADSFEELMTERLLTEEKKEARWAELERLPLPPMPPPVVLDTDGLPERVVGVELGDPTELDDARPTVYIYDTDGADADVVYPRALGDLKPNNSASFVDDWVPPETRWYEDGDSDTYDTIGCLGYLLFRASVREEVEPIVGRYGELLPFTAGGVELLGFKCRNVVDVLAPDADLLEGQEGFMDLLVPRFTSDVVGAGIFTVSQQPYGATLFFTPDVVRELLATGLRLRSFFRIWTEGD